MNRIDPATPTIVVVDMQPYFPASRKKLTVAAVAGLLSLGISRNWPIVVVEMENCGHTNLNLLQLVEQYPLAALNVEKIDLSGAKKIDEVCQARRFPRNRFLVCGVNTMACVCETVRGLNDLLPEARIDLVEAACNDSCDNTWMTFPFNDQVRRLHCHALADRMQDRFNEAAQQGERALDVLRQTIFGMPKRLWISEDGLASAGRMRGRSHDERRLGSRVLKELNRPRGLEDEEQHPGGEDNAETLFLQRLLELRAALVQEKEIYARLTGDAEVSVAVTACQDVVVCDTACAAIDRYLNKEDKVAKQTEAERLEKFLKRLYELH